MALDTPHTRPGEFVLTDEAGDPSNVGGMTRNGDNIRMRDATGIFTPRPTDAGVIQVMPETNQTSSASYVTLGRFLFRGSNLWSTPQALKIVAKVASGTGAVRVQDVTNSLTIAEDAAIVATTDTILDLGTIANVPTGEAVWELQGRHPSAVALDCYCLVLDFSSGSGGGTGGVGFPGRITLSDSNVQISGQMYYLRLYGPTEFPGAEIAAIGTGGAGHPDSFELSTTYT